MNLGKNEVQQFFLYLNNLLKYLTDAPSAGIKDTSFTQSSLLLLKFVTSASFLWCCKLDFLFESDST
jgi:hypothetical protein